MEIWRKAASVFRNWQEQSRMAEKRSGINFIVYQVEGIRMFNAGNLDKRRYSLKLELNEIERGELRQRLPPEAGVSFYKNHIDITFRE